MLCIFIINFAENWDICPTGWHVPFDTNIPQQGDFEEFDPDAIGTALNSPIDALGWQ